MRQLYQLNVEHTEDEPLFQAYFWQNVRVQNIVNSDQAQKRKENAVYCYNHIMKNKKRTHYCRKTKNPRHFKKMKLLPVQYKIDLKVCMSSVLAEKLIMNRTRNVGSKNRKWLLVVNGLYIWSGNISKVYDTCFLAIFVMQPLNRYIIGSLKTRFHKTILQSVENT